MDSESIKTHAALEESYWWFIGRRKVIWTITSPILRSDNKILDWGCGAGGNYQLLSQFGEVLGVDASEEALRLCKERSITNVRNMSEITELPPTPDFDIVSCLDVLEHISDDSAFLQQIMKRLRPQGFVLLTVPAHMFLWSPLDHTLGHVRRYTRSNLLQILEKNGLKVIRASYFISLLFIPFVTVRLLQRSSRSKPKTLDQMVPKTPKLLNSVFIFIMSIEAQILRLIDLPFGTSIVVLAQNKGTAP